VSLVATLYRLTRRKGLTGLYNGFAAETLSTLLSSFIYFYLYSALHKYALRRNASAALLSASSSSVAKVEVNPAGVGGMTAETTRVRSRRTGGAGGVGKLGAGEELLIGLISGVVSKGFVLPLSAVSVRQQLASDHNDHANGDGDDHRSSRSYYQREHSPIRPSHKAKGKGRASTSHSEVAFNSTFDQPSHPKTAWQTFQTIMAERGPLGLWSALPPSIPLALLPALTLYIHQALLALLIPARHRAHPPGAVTFLVGALSNALATVPLYPLIIVKVLSQAGTYSDAKGRLDTFKMILGDRGLGGLYQGIGGQLVKGFVQQGVMMLLKQRSVLSLANQRARC